jgi:GNAT superfamily N-acetyltransferase
MDNWHVSHLDNADPQVAAAILEVMIAAYSVEAEILGIVDFPPLRRTAEQIAAARTAFLGVNVEGVLAAVAELDRSDARSATIDSLVTDPGHTRHGLATALLRHIAAEESGREITVSTAAGNGPALLLYATAGFVGQSRWRTAGGIAMVTLRYQR